MKDTLVTNRPSAIFPAVRETPTWAGGKLRIGTPGSPSSRDRLLPTPLLFKLCQGWLQGTPGETVLGEEWENRATVQHLAPADTRGTGGYGRVARRLGGVCVPPPLGRMPAGLPAHQLPPQGPGPPPAPCPASALPGSVTSFA